MEIQLPLIITGRLMAGAQIGGGFISLDLGPRNSEGRTVYRAYIDLPDGTEHEVTDLRSGCGGGGVQEGIESLLSFLGAAAESRRYRDHTGRVDVDSDSNEGLFPPAVVDWATDNADDISMLQCELEEGELIT